MQCLNPIRIKNQSRFIDSNNRDRLWLLVRCGKCANCQQMKHAEYEFRAYKQFESCVNNGGYVYFDCLTYAPEHLPKLRDIEEFSCLSPSRDYSCFRSEHIVLFNKRLRKRLAKLGFDSDVYSYFLTSEYGLDDRFTHRPHYHVLFYVHKQVDPLLFSRLVASCWNYGRTDGIPYKNAVYVMNNVFRSLSVGSRRVCKYVSKYVMKDNAFDRQINKRIYSVLFTMADGNIDLLRSVEFKRLRQSLRRMVCPFHRQSLGFGISAIYDESAFDIINRGCFLMPNGNPSLYNKIPISNYYLRKLCYEVLQLDDGYKAWSIRPDCLELIKLRDRKIRERAYDSLRNRFDTVGYHPDCDLVKLTEYLFDYCGRHVAPSFEYRTLLDKQYHANLYCYGSSADMAYFGQRFVNSEYLGYNRHYFSYFGDRVSQKVYFDMFSYNQFSRDDWNGFDDILQRLQDLEMARTVSCQSAYDTRMRVNQIAKLYIS